MHSRLFSNTVLDLFRQTSDEWIENARSEAVRQLRTHEYITIEDILRVCPFPGYLKVNIRGQVFKTREFTPIGWTNAQRSLARSHALRQWTLRGESDEDSLPKRRRRAWELESD